MNKADLISKVAENTGASKQASARFLDEFMRIIVESVASGDTVALTGFGAFKVTERQAREAKNPKTGLLLKIPAKRVPRFTPGQAFKMSVANLSSSG